MSKKCPIKEYYQTVLQLTDGKGCDLSLETVGKTAGMSSRMLYACAEVLINQGYIKDCGGQPRLLKRTEKEMDEAGFKSLEKERLQIAANQRTTHKTKKPLFEVFRDYTDEEINEAYKDFIRSRINP